jgi:repressor LexA
MAKRGRGRPTVETLTASQERVLNAIEEHIRNHGMSPTLREISEKLDQGVASVFKMVQRLERNGYVGRMPGKSRSLTILRSAGNTPLLGLVSIPLLGTVAAGIPLFATENMLGELLVDASVVRAGKYFALKVSGQSMIDAGIHPDDILIVRKQSLAEHRDIVVALLNDEATVKRLHHREGKTMLLPENASYNPITVEPEDDLRIIGKVVAVRHMQRDETEPNRGS